MYFKTPTMLTPLLTNFAAAVLHQIKHILYYITLQIFLYWYHDSDFYMDISVYQYITHMPSRQQDV